MTVVSLVSDAMRIERRAWAKAFPVHGDVDLAAVDRVLTIHRRVAALWRHLADRY